MQMLFLFFFNFCNLNYSNICNKFRRYLCHLRIIPIEYLYMAISHNKGAQKTLFTSLEMAESTPTRTPTPF